MVLAESEHLTVFNEYETVYLNFKNRDKRVCIGDFYGDPQAAQISNDERFCIMVGCGMIIYYIREPFEYHQKQRIERTPLISRTK